MTAARSLSADAGAASPRRALVTGAGGFIGGHLVARLLRDGHRVAALDIKPEDQWHQLHVGAYNMPLTDAGHPVQFKNALHSADDVYHLAENMGGIGFIETHRVDCASSVVTSVNLLNALEPDQKVFFSSSACVYAANAQRDAGAETTKLAEHMAHPASPEEGYGWQKLYVEKLLEYHREERGLDVRVARFHNSYGPHGEWFGGREKAPAAICRKVARAVVRGWNFIDVWGDGEQTRSFMYVDDNVEGVVRLMNVDWTKPVNLGSEELVTINDLVGVALTVAGVDPSKFELRHQLEKPQGVRGRNSDNTLLRALTCGWEPATSLRDGLARTYEWVYPRVKSAVEAGVL